MVSGMARLSRFVAVAVLLGGATVSLSACTGGSDPVASFGPSASAVATSSPSASASTSPSPTPLTDEELLAMIPENARGEDFFGASAFGRFMLAEYQRMFVSYDTRLWEAVSSPDCEFCVSSVSDVREIAGTGGARVGGAMTLDPASGIAKGGLRDDGFFYVGYHFVITPWTDTDGDGVVIGSGDAASGETALKMKFVDGHWMVYDIGTVLDP